MHNLPHPNSLLVSNLGTAKYSPKRHEASPPFYSDGDKVSISCGLDEIESARKEFGEIPSFERAGPREKIFFEPGHARVGIVTCGGLCPGINNVIRSVVLSLVYSYQAKEILGFREGFKGLTEDGLKPAVLTASSVSHIHEQGGSILKCSRGPQDPKAMVDTLIKSKVDALIAIGGDGTIKAVQALCKEIKSRNQNISVVAVPKTIDNDVPFLDRCFGFYTAVEEARDVLLSANIEACGAPNGIGVVKLMGRDSGFIATHATLANFDVNICLIPEVPFSLDRVVSEIEKRIRERSHAVIVVAEGAGQDLFENDDAVITDASGNVLHRDIGILLTSEIKKHFIEKNIDVVVKYIDPSYMIRSKAANASDAEFALRLGQHAVHAVMAGKTNLLIGHIHSRFVHIPIDLVAGKRNTVDTTRGAWPRVLEATGQPPVLV